MDYLTRPMRKAPPESKGPVAGNVRRVPALLLLGIEPSRQAGAPCGYDAASHASTGDQNKFRRNRPAVQDDFASIALYALRVYLFDDSVESRAWLTK